MDHETMDSRWSGLKNRLIYGGIAAAIALSCTLYSPLSFYALLLFGALLMYGEWLELTKASPMLNRFGGLVYVGIPIWSLIALRDSLGVPYVLTVFAIVWATDVGAYFGGKRYGKHKLSPTISPGKTWEGLAAGVLAALIVGGIGAFVTHFSPPIAALIGASLAIISQIGDLFESWLKRKANVKDSGNLIPGHGGILDRVDGLVFAAPAYALFTML